MSTIRLQKTDQLQSILNLLRALKFPLLDDTEIIKAVVSEYYSNIQQPKIPTRRATPEEERAIKKGKEEIKKGNYITIRADQEITPDLF